MQPFSPHHQDPIYYCRDGLLSDSDGNSLIVQGFAVDEYLVENDDAGAADSVIWSIHLLTSLLPGVFCGKAAATAFMFSRVKPDV